MLSDPRDLNSLKEFLKLYVPSVNTFMNKLGYTTASVLLPVDDDAQLTNFVRNTVNLTFELWQSFCRMNNNPALGVVNGFGQIYGIKNVRVGDAAVKKS